MLPSSLWQSVPSPKVKVTLEKERETLELLEVDFSDKFIMHQNSKHGGKVATTSV